MYNEGTSSVGLFSVKSTSSIVIALEIYIPIHIYIFKVVYFKTMNYCICYDSFLSAQLSYPTEKLINFSFNAFHISVLKNKINSLNY